MLNTRIISSILIILLFLILVILFINRSCQSHIYLKQTDLECVDGKPYLWVYWELINRNEPPAYIQLCLDTIKKNGSRYFNVVVLNEKTVLDYVDLRTDINSLPIALKTDYIRVCLLCKYGGLWMDADTILMNNLKDIRLKLDEFDFIGFGCTGIICKDDDCNDVLPKGYGKPSNGVMGSVKNGRLMTRCLKALNLKLDAFFNTPLKDRAEFNYFDLGKLTIWAEYEKLINEDPNYVVYHVKSWQDGTRDDLGRWISPDLIFKHDFTYSHPDKLLIVMLANSVYCGKDKKYNWFCELSKNQILEGDYFISKLFRKALKYNPNQ